MARSKDVTITLVVPQALLSKGIDTLEGRGTSLDDWFRLKLKGLVRKPTYYELVDRYTFGKFKGEILEDVIRAEPTYVVWCIREVEGFCLAPAALELLQDMDVDFK